jgi:DNA-binding transcriptional ArsR family regulator
MSVGKIAESLNTEPNGRLTFHLKELVGAGLASTRPEGRFIFYSANYPAMNELLAFLTENCCGGTPCGEPFSPCDPRPSDPPA